MAVIMETTLGDIILDLFTEDRPRCCLNFLKLCKLKYYNFCLFHSVQKNLVAQTGDPTGTGRGGESVFGKLYGDQARYFDMEIKPRIKHKTIGLLSMVNNGDNKHGSQFFLTTGEKLDYLDSQQHTVFGEVSEGIEVLMKINEIFCDKDNRPYQDIRVTHTILLDDPFDDPNGLDELIPDRSPEPTKEQLDSGRIGADEEIDDTKGKSSEEIQQMLREKEAKANAQLLTMVGDLPDEDVAPPETVLFVCKLNPVTTSDDLEIIFSRFGSILSCEVIKDQKSGESLQYAFIEFEKPEDCENAYFKMDNVLIDDRRIHVDFSQSVATVNWKGKGKGVNTPSDAVKNRPAYVIKDTSKKDNYEMVLEDEPDHKHHTSKKKKKKTARSRSKSRSPVHNWSSPHKKLEHEHRGSDKHRHYEIERENSDKHKHFDKDRRSDPKSSDSDKHRYSGDRSDGKKQHSDINKHRHTDRDDSENYRRSDRERDDRSHSDKHRHSDKGQKHKAREEDRRSSKHRKHDPNR